MYHIFQIHFLNKQNFLYIYTEFADLIKRYLLYLYPDNANVRLPFPVSPVTEKGEAVKMHQTPGAGEEKQNKFHYRWKNQHSLICVNLRQ